MGKTMKSHVADCQVFMLLFFVIFSLAGNAFSQLQIKHVNSTTIPLYTKFEIVLDLSGSVYNNPYDPSEIDVQAVFISPAGKQWTLYGFYDNYNNQNSWKVRFAPNETGTWSYTVSATDSNGIVQTTEQQFTAVGSEFHGPVHVSGVNPHYLVQDDGTPFYGVGVYLPWGESVARLNTLAGYNANIFAIWNIVYGGLTNSYGIIENELGRYNQTKCGRIDSLIRLAEDRNMIIQYAIWPHDLFSSTVWAHQWHINPYNQICDVQDIYDSEAAWAYQEKLYRYLIARFGYSRSWGIWEIINEANGTDAWEYGDKYEETKLWVGRVHQYFQDYDPYDHPTTASLSGGRYWPEGYEQVDMPCVHLYETSWSMLFATDPLRSSMWIYHQISGDLWNDFAKPAQFGEAGYTDSYGGYEPGTIEYTASYHNSLWASWSSGLSMTPLWWDFSILGTDDLEQLKAFGQIASLINYTAELAGRLNISASAGDAFGLGNSRLMYGWVRDFAGYSLAGQLLSVRTVIDTCWYLRWYDTWSGELVAASYEASLDSTLEVEVPGLGQAVADLAFIAELTAGGNEPARISMTVSDNRLMSNSSDSATIRCILKDNEGRFCSQAENQITFQKNGPGILLGQNPVNAANGLASVVFRADTLVGQAVIIATSPGLIPDTIVINISNRIIIDDFENYGLNSALLNKWKVRSGTSGELALEQTVIAQGLQSMRYYYAIGDTNASYGTILRSFRGDYNQTVGFACWIKGDGSNRALQIRIRDTTGRYCYYDMILGTTEWQYLYLLYTDLPMSDTVGFNPAKFMEIWFTVRAGSGVDGEGSIYLDDITLLVPGFDPSKVEREQNIPGSFRLYQNYPNPFNSITTFRYKLSAFSRVHLSLYSITGQRVAELIDQRQNAGEYTVRWDAPGLASGLYLYVLEAGGCRFVKKCVLIK